MKIMYSSNAFWSASGYGIQGKSLLPRLADLPVVGGRDNLAMFAWYGLEGGIHQVTGFRCYPRDRDPYGNDVLPDHMRDFGADVLISLIDAWVMRDTAKRIAPAKWLPWLPIDHDPVPPAVLKALDGAYWPLTYSKWGSDLLAGAGIANIYIPHGIEPSVYRVLPAADVAAFKRERLDGVRHLTMMVAANKGFPDRKAFQVQLRAWANFARDIPGARLYIHTDPRPNNGGIDLMALADNLGIASRLMLPNSYQYNLGFAAEHLAMLYNCADVYLGASMGEGFGIPIIEAQACGTPVIVTDFSAMPELVRWGTAVKPLDMVWTQLNSWQAWPDAHGIEWELNSLYAAWESNHGWDIAHREKVSRQIHAEYGWDAIVRDYWQPTLAKVAA